MVELDEWELHGTLNIWVTLEFDATIFNIISEVYQ